MNWTVYKSGNQRYNDKIRKKGGGTMELRSVYWTQHEPVPNVDFPVSWQVRLLHHKQPSKRTQANFAYALLAEMTQKMLGCLPELGVTATGKPYFPDYPQLHFSLSHTQGAAMVAVGDVAVGVDIERVRPVSGYTMARVAQTTDLDVFFAIWVQREATGKCLGTGISHLGTVAPSQGIVCEMVAVSPGYQGAMATYENKNNEKG